MKKQKYLTRKQADKRYLTIGSLVKRFFCFIFGIVFLGISIFIFYFLWNLRTLSDPLQAVGGFVIFCFGVVLFIISLFMIIIPWMEDF